MFHLHKVTMSEEEEFDVLNAVMAFACVTCAALAAGLTLGMLSIDKLYLDVLVKMSKEKPNDEELQVKSRQAKEILKVVHDHHLLLVTLLLLNSIANEALPLFLDNLVPGYVAVLISVTLVLIFGEIVPSAVFTGPDQLRIAASMVPFVRVIKTLLWLIARPIASVLDCMFGKSHGAVYYDRQELSTIVELMHQYAKPGSEQFFKRDSKFLDEDEVKMVSGALSMKTRTVERCIVRWENVYTIDLDDPLNQESFLKIFDSGHSRLPVVRKSDDLLFVHGILSVKRLLRLGGQSYTNSPEPVSSLMSTPLCIEPSVNLLQALDTFQTGRKGHLAIICENVDDAKSSFENTGFINFRTAGVLGIVTLEDVLEALLSEDIEDEFDNNTYSERLSSKEGNVLTEESPLLARKVTDSKLSPERIVQRRSFQSYSSIGYQRREYLRKGRVNSFFVSNHDDDDDSCAETLPVV